MRLPVGIDVVTISTGVAIVLATGNDRTGDTTKDSTGNCTSGGPNAWNNRTDGSASNATDYCARSGARYDVVACRRCCAAAK